jgi:hypothetical protein
MVEERLILVQDMENYLKFYAGKIQVLTKEIVELDIGKSLLYCIFIIYLLPCLAIKTVLDSVSLLDINLEKL